MARDILAILISTIALESAFSIGSRVLDPFRSSLQSHVFEALICDQDWLRLSANLQMEGEDLFEIGQLVKRTLIAQRIQKQKMNQLLNLSSTFEAEVFLPLLVLYCKWVVVVHYPRFPLPLLVDFFPDHLLSHWTAPCHQFWVCKQLPNPDLLLQGLEVSIATHFVERAATILLCFDFSMLMWLLEHLGTFIGVPRALVEGTGLVMALLAAVPSPLPTDMHSRLKELTEVDVVWLPPRLVVDLIFCIKSFDGLTLLGLYGCSSYLPQHFMRQFGMLQDLPYVYGSPFEYSNYDSHLLSSVGVFKQEWTYNHTTLELRAIPTVMAEETSSHRGWVN